MIKGDLKSLLPIWKHLAVTNRYKGLIDQKDIETFDRRAACEGLSFLTHALPKIGKALDKFHSQHVWEPPEGFNNLPVTVLPYDPKAEQSEFWFLEVQLPVFMGKAIKRAIEGDSLAVDCVRQLSYLYYKLEMDYDQNCVAEMLTNFKELDASLLSLYRTPRGDKTLMEVLTKARALICRVLCNEDPLDIRPRHGSGSTACRTRNHEKWHKLRYYQKLDEHFPYSDYFFYNPTHLADELDKLESAEVSEPRARVCLVPKDSRGPRIISCEPAELMYIQQGLMRKLYRIIESHPLTRGLVNFIDQGVNKRAAYLGSLDRDLATLDLKDASDRVSYDLVKDLFPSNWFAALDACRSEETRLPNGEVVKLNKFAPMGSAVCFPIEALTFWALATAATGTKVLVYGDDIICKANVAEQVMNTLEAFGLKLNADKCYIEGPFRESCGGDYHNGYDVTPLRVRKFFLYNKTGSKIPTASYASRTAAIDFANNFIAKYSTKDTSSIVHQYVARRAPLAGSDIDLVKYIEEIFGPLPRTELPIPGTLRLDRCCSNDVFFKRRWNKRHQVYEYHIKQVTTKTRVLCEPAWGELLRKELTTDVLSGTDQDLADESGRVIPRPTKRLDPGAYVDSHSIQIKWQWVWLG